MRLLLLLFTTYSCGFFVGRECGKKQLLQEMQKKSEDFLKNLRVVPLGGVKQGPLQGDTSFLDELMSNINIGKAEPSKDGKN